MRLDHYLKESNAYSSREKAKEAILKGMVLINGKPIKKPAFDYQNEPLEIIEETQYVSRSALKLKEAFHVFNIDLSNHVVVDIGASTGGFTEVALEFGAKKVYALDVGHDQLDERLRKDARVESLEGLHFLKTSGSDFQHIDTILCDVSFISSIKILAHIKDHFHPKQLFILFKPQFESQKRLKNPVIKNPKEYEKILKGYIQEIQDLNYHIEGSINTLKGKQGNQEKIFYLRPL